MKRRTWREHPIVPQAGSFGEGARGNGVPVYRQFSRRFRAAFNATPAAYVEAVRLDEARARLSETHCNIEQLAESRFHE